MSKGTDIPKKPRSEVDLMLGDLIMYLKPGYFLGDLPKPGLGFSEEMGKKYYELITAVNWFQKKDSALPGVLSKLLSC